MIELTTNTQNIITLLISAGVLTIIYEILSNLITFNYSRKKERAEFLINNLYCQFQDTLEVQLFKNAYSLESFYLILNDLHLFDNFIKNEPKILFLLNDSSRINLDKSLLYGEKYKNSHSIYDLANFRHAFTNFSTSYFKQLNTDRKIVGLPTHGFRYRLFYGMHFYKRFSSFFLFIEFYAFPFLSIFLLSLFLLSCISLIFRYFF